MCKCGSHQLYRTKYGIYTSTIAISEHKFVAGDLLRAAVYPGSGSYNTTSTSVTREINVIFCGESATLL